VTTTDLLALLPFIILTVDLVVSMILVGVRRNHVLTFALTLTGLALAFLSALYPLAGARQVTSLLSMDAFASFYIALILAATFGVALLSYGYLQRREENREEYYLLLLTAAIGSSVLAASDHFVSFFLGLEILSVSLYALIAYLNTQPVRVEAGLKYLVLAAVSAAALLFGMALVYAELGTMSFNEIAAKISAGAAAGNPFLLAGFGLIVVGIGYKLALVPFHMWTPDVYQGAPAPVTAFVATVSKGSMFALLLRLFAHTGLQTERGVFVIFAAIAVASMLVGNLLALLQGNIKRILAYSSIAHLGYLLVAFLASGALGTLAATFYLVAYAITNLGAFGVVTLLSARERDAETLEDYRGLFWRHPWLTAFFSAALFSLAGIPLTAGFVGKFYLVLAGAGSALWWLVIILVVTSAIGLYYYLRVVVTLFQRPTISPAEILPAEASSPAGRLALVILAVLLLWLGVYPSPLLRLIQVAASSLYPGLG